MSRYFVVKHFLFKKLKMYLNLNYIFFTTVIKNIKISWLSFIYERLKF